MHPEIGQARAVASLRLCDLVRMVDHDVVFATTVDVKEWAEIPGGHGRALDVPAGEPRAPRAVPLHLPLLTSRAELPQGKVGWIAFPGHVHAAAGLKALDVQARQVTIVGQTAGVKVDAIGGAVGVARRFDAPDDLDLLGDVLGRPAPDVRLQDVETV